MLKNKKGFTLIELLIVVAIIAILAAIAIPQFSQYRMRGFNSSALSDLRNARTSEEAMYSDWQRYGSSEGAVVPGAGAANGALINGPTNPATQPTILTLTDAAGTARGLDIALGNNIYFHANVDALYNSYVMMSKHTAGDTTYGADSDSTANMRYQDPATVAVNVDGVAAITVPASVVSADDLTGMNFAAF
jgi:prepilin-type N-terminal cleavage/methylation domain-containing protein